VSLSERPPSAGHTPFQRWAERLNDFLVKTKSKLAFLTTDDSAGDDGVFLYDRTGYPVVSKGGEWRQVLLADGFGSVYRQTSQAATAILTEQQIVFEGTDFTGHLAWDPLDPTKISFTEGGVYKIDGHLQLASSNANLQTFAYWASINGQDIGHSERQSIAQNGGFATIAISDIITVTTSDYLQINFSVTSTNLTLDGSAAVGDIPASFAAEVYLTRIQQ